MERTLVSDIIRNGFTEVNHTETYEDGTPVYDTEYYRYFEDKNFLITISSHYNSVVFERKRGGVSISSTMGAFYIFESFREGITLGIGNYTTITIGV